MKRYTTTPKGKKYVLTDYEAVHGDLSTCVYEDQQGAWGWEGRTYLGLTGCCGTVAFLRDEVELLDLAGDPL